MEKETPGDNNWLFYDFETEDDGLALVSINGKFIEQEHRPEYSHELSISLNYSSNMQENGLPTPESFEKIKQEEANLFKLLQNNNADTNLVARITFGGFRRLLLETDNVGNVTKHYKQWTNSLSPDFESDIEINEAWYIYEEFIPDKNQWQQIENRKAIEEMIHAGSNPEKIHRIEHTIGGDIESLMRLKTELERREFPNLILTKTELHACVDSELDVHVITDQCLFLIHVAEAFNCYYSGWGTVIVA